MTFALVDDYWSHTFIEKPSADGEKLITVIPILEGRARLTIARKGDVFGYDDLW